MHDADHRRARTSILDRLVQGNRGVGVEGARRLIQKQQTRLEQEYPREYDRLLLTAGKKLVRSYARRAPLG